MVNIKFDSATTILIAIVHAFSSEDDDENDKREGKIVAFRMFFNFLSNVAMLVVLSVYESDSLGFRKFVFYFLVYLGLYTILLYGIVLSVMCNADQEEREFTLRAAQFRCLETHFDICILAYTYFLTQGIYQTAASISVTSIVCVDIVLNVVFFVFNARTVNWRIHDGDSNFLPCDYIIRALFVIGFTITAPIGMVVFVFGKTFVACLDGKCC